MKRQSFLLTTLFKALGSCCHSNAILCMSMIDGKTVRSYDLLHFWLTFVIFCATHAMPPDATRTSMQYGAVRCNLPYSQNISEHTAVPVLKRDETVRQGSYNNNKKYTDVVWCCSWLLAPLFCRKLSKAQVLQEVQRALASHHVDLSKFGKAWRQNWSQLSQSSWMFDHFWQSIAVFPGKCQVIASCFDILWISLIFFGLNGNFPAGYRWVQLCTAAKEYGVPGCYE